MNKQTSSYIETFLNYLSEVDRSYPLIKAELEKKIMKRKTYCTNLSWVIITIKKEQKLQLS